MNKIAKRLVAGASAAALLVSAVGIDQLADLFTKTSYAEYSSKTAKSTGFNNLEQDTDKDSNYNTGYGLHTNKTATALDDGRTFNVNLESWYVGENPVDVATILDASGSMAWTVDTLKPLEFNEASTGLDVNTLKVTYEIQDKDLEKYTDYKDDLTKVLAAIQDKEGGYLPQEVVDKILLPENTDDSKLSYADYMYYIYESRSSVSEFVPLGYWNGGKTAEKFSPIGYYPFDGSLKNEVNNAMAKLIKHAADTSGTFDKDSVPTDTIEPTYVKKSDGSFDSTLDIDETAEDGALLADVQVNGSFTVAMRVKADQIISNGAGADNTPLIYIGNGKDNYISVYRNGSDPRRLKVTVNGHEVENIGNLFQKESTDSTTEKKLGSDNWINIALTYNDSTKKVSVDLSVNGKAKVDGADTVSNHFDIDVSTYSLNFDKADIIIGGDVVNDTHVNPYTNTQLTAFCVFNHALTEDTDIKNVISDSIKTHSKLPEGLAGYYDFGDEDSVNRLGNRVAADGSLSFIEQAEDKTFSKTEIKSGEANPEYSSDSHSGSRALNVSQTAKLGAVLLDVAPKNSTFTLSFAVKKTENSDMTNADNVTANLLYIGDMNATDYYQIMRREGSSNNRLAMRDKDGETYVNINKVFGDTNYKVITIVVNGKTVTQYKDGEKYTEDSPNDLSEEITADDLALIIGGLWDDGYNGADILIDDLYVFDKALDADQVAAVAKATEGQTQFAKVPSALTGGCKGYHATMKDTDVDIAQISERLAQNPNDEERRGWYYVNSHSKWADIEDCLASGKQYVGIFTDEGLPDGIKDNVTIPAGMDDILKQSIKEYEDTSKLHADYDAPTTERSIRFYVDGMNHLRCFVWSGADSKADKEETKDIDESDPRTFCSLVYEKKDNQQTKYQALNGALNGFYKELAGYSDLSNTAVVRFSTINAVGKVGKSTGEDKDKIISAADENLKMLVMKDWTNWSDYYQADMEKHKTEPDYMPDTEDYLQNLLDVEGKTSISTTLSNARNDIDEYPYVMTGGTYTWTGLKAFYDNMVKSDGKTTGYKPYDIANDARDKYLIIFTDGRDNTQDLGTADNGKVYNDTAYCKDYSPKDHAADCDGELAKAWADQLKDEGYTIYCVMMATGSISESANETEYIRAKDFLKTLAGANEGDERDLETASDPKATDRYIRVVKNDSTALNDAFAAILKDIQQPRNDYTVQDYIDPRFDLVDADGNLYKLGAGGKITVTKDGEAVTGLKYSDGSTFTNGNAVGNIIDSIDNGTTVKGLAYTPMESYMVNRKADSSSDDGYNTGDGFGTGYIYYDDVKDMYYLRWTDQIIPMKNKAFDTEEGKPETYLDVWSATIRLKAKDDFIGGNNILTNGNEAGENLVYSDATIENMDKGDNYKLYGFNADQLKDGKIPYREKLKALSGTDRKINAVDADGVSQAVYGNGIDIPSSGFPRTTVNVRLLKLDAKNLNDVIYMGEVVSPTMMLADLENGYMTGSYYLQYLERYAYRVYGEDADSMPLIELLNKWLKIDDDEEASKTFTIPYIYLPDPEYDENGKLKIDDGKVLLQNSTGASWQENKLDFDDLNLRDVTGFITYTWKRDSGSEKQQDTGKTNSEGNPIYDITKDYVAKNTKQIKYNLQLKFTPLKETAEELKDFKLDEYFIIADPTAGTGGDKFFNIVSGEFAEMTTDGKWTTDYGREDYLQAMISEKRTYTPHVIYDDAAGDGKGKWELVAAGGEADACETYADGDDQITTDTAAKTVTDKGVYDWDSTYKKAPGKVQLEGEDLNTYTSTPENVNFANATGEKLSEGEAPVSLAANTTYTKDVVNAALALELFVDGKYLNKKDSKITENCTFTFLAIRNYKDPYNKPSYAAEKIGADASDQKYKLTFKVTDIPAVTNDNEIYKVWATLTNVAVLDEDNNKYISINTDPTTDTESIKSYLGYTAVDALPIGTYVIKTESDATKLNSLKNEQFKIGTNATGEDVNFKYLKIENDKQSYAYDKFPESVYTESDTAAESTKDGEYLIWNEDTSKDNSKKNIADNKRVKDSATDTQTVTFYFGTVAEKTVSEDITLTNTKGVSVKEYLKENPDDPTLAEFKNDYAKDRLGIIMLSADNNSLAISKKVDNTDKSVDKNRSWKFTVTVKPESGDATTEFNDQNTTGFKLKWYKDDALKTVAEMNEMGAYTSTVTNYPETITFDGSGNIYTATIYLKHDEKVVIDGLPEGTWQVTEDLGGVFCTPHNDQSEFGEDEWQYNRADSTRADGIDLTPASQVNYINEFPYELPSTGGSGTVRYLLMGTALISVGAMLFAMLYFDRRKKARK